MTGSSTSSDAPSQSGIVLAFMECMTGRDIVGALGFVHESIEIWEPPGLPYGGTWHGHAGFVEFAQKIAETWRTWRDGPYLLVDAGGTTFKANAFTAESRRTGKVVEMHIVEVISFRDDKIVGVRPHYWDTAGVIAALEGSPDR